MKKVKVPKIIIVGAPECGKTCLAHRMVDGEWAGAMVTPTYSANFYQVNISDIKVGLWDVGGHGSTHSTMLPLYMRDCDIIWLCYKKSDAESLKSAKNLYERVIACADFLPLVFMVGTHQDEQIHNKRMGVNKFCQKHGFCGPFYISNKTGYGIEIFIDSVRQNLKEIRDGKVMLVEEDPEEFLEKRYYHNDPFKKEKRWRCNIV